MKKFTRSQMVSFGQAIAAEAKNSIFLSSDPQTINAFLSDWENKHGLCLMMDGVKLVEGVDYEINETGINFLK